VDSGIRKSILIIIEIADLIFYFLFYN